MKSSAAAFNLSSLDVSGMGDLVGRKIAFSTGMVAFVSGTCVLCCLWWCIAGPAHQPCLPLSDQVDFRFSFG